MKETEKQLDDAVHAIQDATKAFRESAGVKSMTAVKGGNTYASNTREAIIQKLDGTDKEAVKMHKILEKK